MRQHTFKKRFGQNFLSKPEYIVELLEAAELTKQDIVLEIGPGSGAVTEYLLGAVEKVLSVEIDAELIPLLQTRFVSSSNFQLLGKDVLDLDPDALFKNQTYKIVGSLPYNISKRIIKKFLENKNKPLIMAFIVQKEVALKYTSKAPKASFLGNYANLLSDTYYKITIPKEAFYPAPQVAGAIIVFKNLVPKYSNWRKLLKFIKVGFSAPRKKLSRNLANIGYTKTKVEAMLSEIGFPDTARASELELEQWQKLFQALPNRSSD